MYQGQGRLATNPDFFPAPAFLFGHCIRILSSAICLRHCLFSLLLRNQFFLLSTRSVAWCMLALVACEAPPPLFLGFSRAARPCSGPAALFMRVPAKFPCRKGSLVFMWCLLLCSPSSAAPPRHIKWCLPEGHSGAAPQDSLCLLCLTMWSSSKRLARAPQCARLYS